MKQTKRIIVLLLIIILLFSLINIFKVHDIILEKLYPLEYQEQVEEYSKQYGVDKYLIYAIIKAESNFDEFANSVSGAKGLMQIMDDTARDIAENLELDSSININLYDAQTNIMFGIKYISDLIKEYNNEYLALAAYNAGKGNVKKWIENGIIRSDGSDIENIPFKETNLYVRKTIQNYKVYKEIYGLN